MKPGFEKKFTDVQIGLISLCLEAVSMNVDAVYAYAYIGKGSSMFNMFYKCGGSIVPAHKLLRNNDLHFQVMHYGTDDLEKLRLLCVEYETKCPMEMKMYYDCMTKKFSADYQYDVDDSIEYSPHDAFQTVRRRM